MKIKKWLKNPPVVTAILLIVFIGFFYFGGELFRNGFTGGVLSEEKKVLSQYENENCVLLYSDPVCKNNNIYIAFHNPNKVNVKKIKVTFMRESGIDTANVVEPLPVEESKTAGFPLQMFHDSPSCEEVKNSERKLEWCCNQKCYTIPMNSPDKNLKVVFE